nr:phage major capsid protein, P2 family [Saccharospirillaceae bacterium]
MKNTSRKAFNDYRNRLAALNQVESAAEQFSVEPSVQQTLETRMQESSAFLSMINVVGVDELKGQKIGLGTGSTIAGRTNTDSNDRNPRYVGDKSAQDYELHLTEFDTAVPYAKIDAWAKFPDFQARLRDVILRQQALDRIMIGWNGTSAATATDRVANPLLQDVNIGWIKQYKDHAAARVMSEVVASSGEVTVGSGGDYANLDALVFDAVNELIEPWYQESPDLVVLLGRKLMADKYFPLINQDNKPSEHAALDMLISQKRVGGLQAVRVPYIPDGTMMITPLDNLSIYWQNGARRRHIVDNPKRSRIENYESSNDGYVVEDYDAGCVIENITLV